MGEGRATIVPAQLGQLCLSQEGGRDINKKSRSDLIGADGVVLVKKSWPAPPRLRDMVASQLLLDRASTPPRLRICERIDF